MRTILFYTLILLTTSCVNNTEPVGNATGTPVPSSTNTVVNAPNSELQGKAFTISTDAFYQSTSQSPSTQGQVFSLSLTPDHNAEMTINNMDDSQGSINSGVWTTLQNGNLHLRLKEQGSNDSLNLEFKTDGDRLVYSGEEFGTTGLTLYVKPVPKAN